MGWREFCAWPEPPAPPLDRLTPAELAVLVYLRHGATNREIATTLGKSACTVKNQVSAILAKLGVPRRGRLMAMLREMR